MRVIHTLAIAFLLIAPAYGQKPVKCRVKEKDNHAPKYNVGWNAYSVEGSRTLLLAISVKPQHFNRDDITRLARQLNKVFCREQRLYVIILDNRRAAREFRPTNEGAWFQRHIRGYYAFDRTTGDEGVTFSTDPSKPDDEIKITFR